MKHSRKDYDRIQDPLNLIPADEPVFLLRSQDLFCVPMLIHYRQLTEDHGGLNPETKDKIDNLEHFINRVRNWQSYHKAKFADLPNEYETSNILARAEKETQNQVLILRNVIQERDNTINTLIAANASLESELKELKSNNEEKHL